MIRPDAVTAVFTQPTVQYHHRLLVFLDDLIHLIDAEKTRVDDDRITAHIEQILNRFALFIGAVLAIGKDQLPPSLLGHSGGMEQQLAEIDPMIEGVGHHQPEGLCAFGRQVARQ